MLINRRGSAQFPALVSPFLEIGAVLGLVYGLGVNKGFAAAPHDLLMRSKGALLQEIGPID